jgi:hypothetical protein
MNSRIHAFVDCFEISGSFELFITGEHWEILRRYMAEHNIPEPMEVERSCYKLIRLSDPRTLQLPGSPIMYYMMDGSALVRRVRVGGLLPARGLWCGHIHSDDQTRVKVTRAGINPVHHCLFARLKGSEFFVKTSQPVKMAPRSEKSMLLKVIFRDRKVFQHLIEMARLHMKIRLFCERVLEYASAHIVIQSAMRGFIQRLKYFKQMKPQVLEARARSTLQGGLLKMHCFAITKHVAAIARYYQRIRGTRAFFVTEAFLAAVPAMPVLRQVRFGYSRERTVVLSDDTNGALQSVIPTGPIVFALSDLDHLLHVGTLIASVSSKSFSALIPAKWLVRSKIMRISMIQPNEAHRRMVLFTWMTGDTTGFMTETGVIEFCTAASIQSAWRGFIMRSTTMRLLDPHWKAPAKRPAALAVQGQKDTLEIGLVVVVKARPIV